jgi:Protein of unknown function (DUF2490)
MKTIFLTIATLLVTNLVNSQKSEIGSWLMYFGNQKINSNWNWHNEIQYRSYDIIGDTNQLLIRTGFGYNLSQNNNNLLVGYAYINTQNYVENLNEKLHVNEHRIYQQFITKQNFWRIFLQHRYRVEERFLSNDLKIRFRYLIGVSVPINKKALIEKAIYISAYNEIFINSEKPLFDRNRLYGAIGYVVSENIKVEAGFMAQTLENKNKNQLQLALYNTLPF